MKIKESSRSFHRIARKMSTFLSGDRSFWLVTSAKETSYLHDEKQTHSVSLVTDARLWRRPILVIRIQFDKAF